MQARCAVIHEDQKQDKGPAALKSVDDASGAIGEHARGQSGSGMREATQKFCDTVEFVGIAADQLKERVASIGSANYDVMQAFTTDAVQKQARVVGNNKDAVTEEEKNIEWQGKQRTSRRFLTCCSGTPPGRPFGRTC